MAGEIVRAAWQNNASVVRGTARKSKGLDAKGAARIPGCRIGSGHQRDLTCRRARAGDWLHLAAQADRRAMGDATDRGARNAVDGGGERSRRRQRGNRGPVVYQVLHVYRAKAGG